MALTIDNSSCKKRTQVVVQEKTVRIQTAPQRFEILISRKSVCQSFCSHKVQFAPMRSAIPLIQVGVAGAQVVPIISPRLARNLDDHVVAMIVRAHPAILSTDEPDFHREDAIRQER